MASTSSSCYGRCRRSTVVSVHFGCGEQINRKPTSLKTRHEPQTTEDKADPLVPKEDVSHVPRTKEEMEAAFGKAPTWLEGTLAWAPWVIIAIWVVIWGFANVALNGRILIHSPSLFFMPLKTRNVGQQIINWPNLNNQIYLTAYKKVRKHICRFCINSFRPSNSSSC